MVYLGMRRLGRARAGSELFLPQKTHRLEKVSWQGAQASVVPRSFDAGLQLYHQFPAWTGSLFLLAVQEHAMFARKR